MWRKTITAPKLVYLIAATTGMDQGPTLEMTTSNYEVWRCVRRWLGVFTFISLVMGALQWLVFARGGGAQNWVYRLADSEHLRASETLRKVNEAAVLRSIDRVWQTVISAPRNHLYAAVGIINSPDSIYFYGTSERAGWWPDFRDWLVFSLGTVAVYLPVLLAVAWMQARMRMRSLHSRRAI